MGVSCARSNVVSCDRVGLAVWLRGPAEALAATVSGRPVEMHLPCSGSDNGRPCRDYCREPGVRRDQPCGTYFEGFLRPAGLLDGPLRVHPDAAGRWTGAHRPIGRVRLTARYRGGRVERATVRVPLAAGWG